MNNERWVEQPRNSSDTIEELSRLRAENTRLQQEHQLLLNYIRAKTNQMLDVIGTAPLTEEELNESSLVESDPIGTVAESFRLFLAHLHQTNDRLALANKEIHEIVDAAGAGIMVVDREGRIITVNARISELFGLTSEAAAGQRCSDLICHSGSRPPVCALKEVVDRKSGECRVEWNEGERCFEVVGRPILDAGGAVTHVVIVYADVTARKRNEEALRQALNENMEERARIEGILRSVGDGLLVTDLQQRIILMNPAAEEFLGLQGQELPMPLAVAVPDHSLQMAIGSAASNDTIDRVDFQLPASDRVCEGKISVLRRADGTKSGKIVLIRDVTLARTVERMKSEFVATAAHEFRTPLTAILGFTELLLDPDQGSAEERVEFLQLVHEKADSLARMVNHLLDISRIESGEELPLDRGPNLLASLLGRVLPLFQKRVETHAFKVSLSSDDILLNVDPDTIEQVFENIIGNAVKYSPAGGEVAISAAIEGGECLISVADQGLGMTSDELTRVFDKFFRADGSNTAVRGTGLGMTIVRHIVEAHGGRIWLESAKGRGTKVSFTLPLVRAD